MTISKASGETPIEHFHTPEPRITFILSYSSYHLEIRAFNNASTSPALHHTIRRREEQLGERFSVLLRSGLGVWGDVPTEAFSLLSWQV